MVLLTNKKSPKTGIKGQLSSLFTDMAVETLKAVKETGKEVVLGVTMLPKDLVVDAMLGGANKGADGKEKSWEEEWLKDPDKKDKPPLAEKEGGHTKINPAEMSKKSGQAEEEAVRRRLSGILNSQYSRASAGSTYGQQQAQKYQEEHMSVFDKQKREEEQKKAQMQNQPKQSSVPMSQGKKKLGMGQKRQKTPMTMENKASQGKQ